METKSSVKKRKQDVTGDLIRVEEVKRGMHERAEGITNRTIYRISRNGHSGHTRRLFGLWPADGGSGSGKFVKLSPDEAIMPEEAVRLYREAAANRPPDETAVFLNTRLADFDIEAVMAVRYSERWAELYHWRTSWEDLGISRTEISQF